MKDIFFKKVKPGMLRKLPLHSGLRGAADDSNPPHKGSFFGRFVARHVAASILNNTCSSYQFGGRQGRLKPEYLLIDADKHQLAHWVLHQAGYSCCCADLMKLTGKEEV